MRARSLLIAAALLAVGGFALAGDAPGWPAISIGGTVQRSIKTLELASATANGSTVTLAAGAGLGGDPCTVAHGCTGATTAASARTALGLAIGTDVQAQSAQLASIAAIGNGLPAHTAANTFTARSIAAGANVAVTNGDGIAGNPTVALSGVIPFANGGLNTAAAFTAPGPGAFLLTQAGAGQGGGVGVIEVPYTDVFPIGADAGGTGLNASGATNGQIPIGNGNAGSHAFTLGAITGGGGVIVTNGSGTISLSTSGGGDAGGPYSAMVLASTGVAAATYGSATQVAQVTLDVKGRATAAANVSIAVDAAAITTGTLPVARGGIGNPFAGCSNGMALLTPDCSTIGVGFLGTAAMTDNAVTAAKIAATALRLLGGLGLAAAGAVTLTGAKVGDAVSGVVDVTAATSVKSDFESIITVNDQIQQTAGVLTAHVIIVLLVAKGG